MKEMSEVVVQGQWFTGCDSVVVVRWCGGFTQEQPPEMKLLQTLSVLKTDNCLLMATRSSFISWKDIGIEGFVSRDKKLSEHIDEFNKLIDDLVNIDVDIDDEDQALMLLTSLQSLYDNFMEELLHGRESFTLEDACLASIHGN
ncbi:hypothetical protein Tco_0551664 [Tanacetum coccineum]